jgi:hypothetical protein
MALDVNIPLLPEVPDETKRQRVQRSLDALEQQCGIGLSPELWKKIMESADEGDQYGE